MTARLPAFRTGKEAQAGFMLVEMLVAMAIGAFLLLALASVTSLVLRAHGRQAAQAAEFEEANRTLAALSREIATTARIRWAGPEGRFIFAGSPDAILFARQAPAENQREQAEAVRFESLRDGTSLRFVRVAAPLLPDATAPADLAWGPPLDVAGGRFRVAFAYFERLEGGGEALLDTWPSGGDMPAAVRVSLLPSAASVPVLSLRVPLLIDAELSCALPKATRCNGRDSENPDGSAAEEVTPND